MIMLLLKLFLILLAEQNRNNNIYFSTQWVKPLCEDQTARRAKKLMRAIILSVSADICCLFLGYNSPIQNKVIVGCIRQRFVIPFSVSYKGKKLQIN